MRFLFACVAIFCFGSVQADELDFTISGYAFYINDPSVPPSIMTLQFIMDTDSGTANFLYDANGLSGFRASGLTLTDVSLTYGNTLLMSAPTVTAGLFGDREGGLFFSSLGFSSNGLNVGWGFDARSGPDTATAGDVASLFDSFIGFSSDGGGVGDTIGWDETSVTIREIGAVGVPEPGALPLMGLGALVMWFHRKAMPRLSRAK